MANRQLTRRGTVDLPVDMREIVLEVPGRRLDFVQAATPAPAPGEALVRTLLAGVDGTDEEIVAGAHGGDPPEGKTTLVLGHEALGEVVRAPEGAGLASGDLVVPLVRHGCGMCVQCRYDAPDVCPSDDFVEHGIKGLDGFMRTYWTEAPEGLVKAPEDVGELAILTEPLSIVVKALEEARHIQQRIPWFEAEGGFAGKRALIAGTGSLGSLGAFLLRHEGAQVWAMDRSPAEAFAARLLSGIGVQHVNAREQDILDLSREVGGFDLVIEATGAPRVAFDLAQTLAPNGVMGLLGVPPDKAPFEVDGARIMRRLVVGNQVVFGSVNSNRRHYEAALQRLRAFKERWGGKVAQVITHTFTPAQYQEAFEADEDDMIKKVVDWRGSASTRQPHP